jgi:hypothetical protein
MGRLMSEPRVRLYPPHLDAPLTKPQAEALASNPERVAHHAFFPFLQRNQRWTKYAKKGEKPSNVKTKLRPIRYASRRDSYIFGYYRKLLNQRYEDELRRRGLQNCVLAYRRIARDGGRGGKCNVDFAKEAFEAIRKFGTCYALALDVRQFFENLDHEHIKRGWWHLLGRPAPAVNSQILPKDHFQVFKAVTQYSYIDADAAYKKLNLIGEVTTPTGGKRLGYRVPHQQFPPRICSPKDFREKLKDLIKRNPDPFGIPQGSPISDLLANLYMIDFDDEMNCLISSLGGKYLRYSDDILLLLPASLNSWQELVSSVKSALGRTAPHLELKDEKTQVYKFFPRVDRIGQENEILNLPKGTDGLEYLGFRYDGRRIFLRNSTISGVQRKITSMANAMARRHIKTSPALGLQQLIDSFNYGLLISKFGRVKNFDESEKRYTSWTFWTYVERSGKILGDLGEPVKRQMRGYKAFAREKAVKAVVNAYKHGP